MEPLFKAFEKIPKSYYGIDIKAGDLFGIDGSSNECRNFIEKHFVDGSKGSVLKSIPFFEEYQRKGKHAHTVALYLLGLHLDGIFKSKILDDAYQRFADAAEWYKEDNYKYTWFLTCLYHDAASSVEKLDDVPDMYHEDKNKYRSPFEQGRFRQNMNLNRRTEDTVNSYWLYRKSCGEQDHGILAGYLLYDRLCSNFEHKTSCHNWNEKPIKEDGGLMWHRGHIDHYAYVADAIITHNMWTANIEHEKRVQEYQENGLSELVISRAEDKLSFAEYPLHFMLCLLDSIEPVKRFQGQLSVRMVLDNISITYCVERKQIMIGWSPLLKSKPGFYDWQKNIVSLSDWMNVEVIPCQRGIGECCYVTIDIR